MLTLFSDLFNPEYTVGQMDSISWVANIIGKIAMTVISIVGFGIVMSSIFKNAVHGLYATNATFWDKVHDVKTEGIKLENELLAGKTVFKRAASFGDLLLKLVPDVKSMTDFAEKEGQVNAPVLDPKEWFTKSLPLMILQIFIGVLIFMGYPSKAAQYIAEFGAGTLDVVFSSVDPTAWIEYLPTNMTIYSISTDGALDSESQQVNALTRKAVSTIVAKYTDIPKTKREALAIEVEKWLLGEADNLSEYLDKDKYSMTYTSTIAYTTPDVSRLNNGTSPKVGADGVATYAIYDSLDRYVGSDWTLKDITGVYIRIDMVFTPVVSSGNKNSVESKVSIPKAGSGSAGWSVLTGKLSIVFYTDSSTASLRGLSTISGSVGGERVVLKLSGNTVEVSVSGKTSWTAGEVISDIKGLYYKIGDAKHPITEIVLTSSGNIVFTPESPTYNSWEWGGSPQAAVASE